MILYISIIVVCSAIIASTSAILTELSALNCILATILSVLVCILIDAVIAIAVRTLPKHFFEPNNIVFKERKHEKAFYDFIKIRKWKDKIPETGQYLVKFSKTHVKEKDNTEYLQKFLLEVGYAEVMHFISAFLGFLVIFILPLEYALMFGFPVGLVNLLLQFPPFFVQRYNRPKLLMAIKRATRNY